MTDFLSRHFGAPVRIDLGDDYWVEVKPLNKGDIAACQAKLTRMRIAFDPDAGTPSPSGDMDIAGYQEEVVCRSIVAWNLDGPDGPLPTSPLDAMRASYRLLPNAVADEIYATCDRLNAPPSKAEEVRFRESGERGPEGPAAPRATTGAAGTAGREDSLAVAGVAT